MTKLHIFDFDNTFLKTEFGEGLNNYDIVGNILFGHYYKDAVRLFTNLTFKDGKKEKWEKYNLPSKAKFYKLAMIYDDLRNKIISLEELKEVVKSELKDEEIENLYNFMKELMDNKIISEMKNNAIKTINRMIKNFDEKKISKLKKDKWNIWQLIDDKLNVKNVKKILNEYKKNIKLLKEDEIGIQEAIEKIFFPMSALYDVFGNEPVKINLDLITKSLNHSRDKKYIQCINSLKDKGALIETMKLLKKIGNPYLKDFVKIFYDYDEDTGRIKKDMIFGTTQHSSKRREIRSLEILYHPEIQKQLKQGEKIDYVILGDGIDAEEKNGNYVSKSGKDNYTLTNLFDNINDNKIGNLKKLLESEDRYKKTIIGNELNNSNNLNNYLRENISKEGLFIEMRLGAEVNKHIDKKNVLTLLLKNVSDSNINMEKYKTKLKNTLTTITNEEKVNGVMSEISKELDNITNNNPATKKELTFNLKNKISNKDIKIHFNFNKDNIRPLKELSFKNNPLIKQDKELSKVYNEFIKTGFHKNINFEEYLYKNFKKFNKDEKLAANNKKQNALKALENYFKNNKEKIAYIGH